MGVRVLFHGFAHSDAYQCAEMGATAWRKGKSMEVDEALYARLAKDFGDAFEKLEDAPEPAKEPAKKRTSKAKAG